MTIVGEPIALPRSETEKIWVSLSEFRGFYGIDIRIYYQAGEADWRPTKKGVRISLELKDDLIAAIEKVTSQPIPGEEEAKPEVKPEVKPEANDEEESSD